MPNVRKKRGSNQLQGSFVPFQNMEISVRAWARSLINQLNNTPQRDKMAIKIRSLKSRRSGMNYVKCGECVLLRRNAYKRLSHNVYMKNRRGANSLNRRKSKLLCMYVLWIERKELTNQKLRHQSIIVTTTIWGTISSRTGCRIQEQLNVTMLHVTFVLQIKNSH